MTVTKANIVENLFARDLFIKGESAQIIETLFELIKQSLQNGEDVMISDFGKFWRRKNTNERDGTHREVNRWPCLPARWSFLNAQGF